MEAPVGSAPREDVAAGGEGERSSPGGLGWLVEPAVMFTIAQPPSVRGGTGRSASPRPARPSHLAWHAPPGETNPTGVGREPHTRLERKFEHDYSKAPSPSFVNTFE